MPLLRNAGVDFVPHDHANRPLKVGDLVVVPCIVTGIDKHPDFINVALETRWAMEPGPNKTPIILNTKQVLLVESSREMMPDSIHVMDVIEEIKKTGSEILKGR